MALNTLSVPNCGVGGQIANFWEKNPLKII